MNANQDSTCIKSSIRQQQKAKITNEEQKRGVINQTESSSLYHRLTGAATENMWKQPTRAATENRQPTGLERYMSCWYESQTSLYKQAIEAGEEETSRVTCRWVVHVYSVTFSLMQNYIWYLYTEVLLYTKHITHFLCCHTKHCKWCRYNASAQNTDVPPHPTPNTHTHSIHTCTHTYTFTTTQVHAHHIHSLMCENLMTLAHNK